VCLRTSLLVTATLSPASVRGFKSTDFFLLPSLFLKLGTGEK